MAPDSSSHADAKLSRGDGNESSEEEEEEEEEEEGEDDEFFDLLEVLDGKGDIDMGSDGEQEKKTEEKVKERPTPKVAAKAVGKEEGFEESDSGSESDVEDEESADEEDEGEEDDRMSVDDEADPTALDQLEAFVSGLDTRKRKADNEEGEEKTKKKKRVVLAEEQNEVGAENEFRVRSGRGAKLDLDDLLAPLEADDETLDALKKSTKVLTTSKTKTLSAPLAYRAQDRLDREAAYEQTKEEVDKWGETMRRIREAEHLSFPLQAQSAPRASNATLTATFKPSTSLESSIDALLRKAKLRDEDIMQTEDTLLASNGVSAQEVAERRAEVRRMKELVYRAELKSRRANKIKSRVYRKIKRREKDAVSGDVDDAEDEEGKLKREYERAKERATLKHKRTGNWAKHAHDDVNVRKDVEDMLSRSERLRRRIAGAASGSEEESEDDSEEDEETTKQRAFEELSRLRDEEDVGDQGKAKGVYGMKFMQDAMKRKDAAVNESLDRFIAELGEQEGDDSPEGDEASPSGAVIERRGGRILLRPGVSTAGLEISTKHLPSVAASDTSSVTLRSTDLLSPPPMSPTQTKRTSKSLLSQLPEKGAEMETDNPWLKRGVGEVSTKVSSSKNHVIVSKDSKAADKSSYKLAKREMEAKKSGKGKEKEVDDADVEIDISGGLLLASAPSASKDKGSSTTRSQPRDEDESDEDDELQAQEASLFTGKRKENALGIRAFEQRDLVARAFVGDNVVEVSINALLPSSSYIFPSSSRSPRRSSARLRRTHQNSWMSPSQVGVHGAAPELPSPTPRTREKPMENLVQEARNTPNQFRVSRHPPVQMRANLSSSFRTRRIRKRRNTSSTIFRTRTPRKRSMRRRWRLRWVSSGTHGLDSRGVPYPVFLYGQVWSYSHSRRWCSCGVLLVTFLFFISLHANVDIHVEPQVEQLHSPKNSLRTHWVELQSSDITSTGRGGHSVVGRMPSATTTLKGNTLF